MSILFEETALLPIVPASQSEAQKAFIIQVDSRLFRSKLLAILVSPGHRKGF